jgi:hypothetical protein
MADTAPLLRTIETEVAAQATAGTVQDQVIGEAPFAGTVTEVTIIPEAAVTANATNFRTFRVVNKGQAGAGTTVVATFATDTVTTDDLAAFDEKTIPLSGTAANLVVAAGDVLAADETVTGTGVAHGGYTIKVTISRS